MRRTPDERHGPGRFTALLTAAAVLAAATPAPATTIFLKDGFVLQGTVKQGSTLVVEGGEAVPIPQGATYVDDGVRRFYFSPTQVEQIDERPSPVGEEIKWARQPAYYPETRALPPIFGVIEATPWNDKWDRTVTLRGAARPMVLPQHLLYLSPRVARVISTGNYKWGGCYLTRELGPVQVRALLSLHPELTIDRAKDDPTNAGRRLRAVNLLAQIGWYNDAQEELLDMSRRLPTQKDRFESALESIKNLRGLELVTQIKQAQASGRYQWAQKQLAEFPEKDADDNALGQVRVLRVKQDEVQDQLKLARKFLGELPRTLERGAARRLMIEASEVIAQELNPDNLERLANFVTFASQAERLLGQGGKPEQTNDQLLALAVTGWVLGNSSAEAKVETAQRLWRGRQLVLKYQRTPEADAREQLLQDYLGNKSEVLSVEEMSQLIASLPPPRPEDKVSAERVELKTDLPEGDHQPITYHLQAPPEYNHGRPHPVLFLLHSGAGTARDMLYTWSRLAAQHGYLLVAPEWKGGLDSAYGYTGAEHRPVLDVLRDLRRRFQVDSDRVFLFGLGEGGSMAFDVGLAHPDLFAGVLPMSGHPGPYARLYYWRNAQYLPFYVVGGDYAGEPRKAWKELFNEWVPRGFPSVWIEYRGRGLEWFEGEMPQMFDWMNHKKRAQPLLEAGRGPNAGREFVTMRPGDDRFYWLGATEIHERHFNDSGDYNNRVTPASLYAKVGEGNTINVSSRGVKQLTLWFRRGMVDFDKPVSVAVNLNGRRARQKVTPSLQVLLEDYYQRGDRQQLFVARVDFDKLP